MARHLMLIGLATLLGAAPAAAQHWVGSWAASQQIADGGNALPAEWVHDVTVRENMRLSLGGTRLRVRVSNVFGNAPLIIDAIRIARTAGGDGATVLAGDRPVTFGGAREVIIPAGAELTSDPVTFAVAPLATIAVSLHLPQLPAQQTGHPGSRANSWLVHGERTSTVELEGAQAAEHWYFLSGIDVEAAPGASAVVTLGDSITDGHGVDHGSNGRWPDILAARLQADPRGRRVAVLNQGIGGNRVLLDGIGPNALARFERDVLAMPGVRTVILLESVNDLGTFTREAPQPPEGHQALVRRLIQAYGEMIRRAHERGIRVIGGTITPYAGSDYYHPTAVNEADRQALNSWIRAPGHFDGVADFDAALRDPAHPERMRAALDGGDHLHPSMAGYRAMGEAVPLALLTGGR